MCTVTYLPGEAGGYFLTSNRDESPARSPRQISVEETPEYTLLFPRDTQAGGTWIATSNADRTVCLLNGAFSRHTPRPPYKRSRGVMVLDFFSYPEASLFFDGYDFYGMEPFTMIIIDGGRLFDLRWDEKQSHVRELDPQGVYIWSSPTLFDLWTQQKREQWFRDWLAARRSFDRQGILDFHYHAGEGDPWNDVVMNRNGVVQTVSITSIIRQADMIEMSYHSLVHNQVRTEKIKLRGEVAGLR